MSTRVCLGAALSACLLNTLLGCSGASAPAVSDLKLAAADSTAPAAACDAQAVQAKDVAGILVAPITATKPVVGDAQSCEYSTGGFPAITISVRPGLGRSTVDSWIAGKMPLKASPVAGIGEAAAWQASLHELIAQQRDLLCEIEVRGGATDIAVSAETLPAALGALCKRIFAAG